MPDEAVPEPLMVDLSTSRRVHVVGVGGAGMSAIASVLASMGHQVSGSDLKESAGLDRLRTQGVTVAVGHDASNLAVGTEYVAISTAVPDTNPEVRAAAERGTPVLNRAEILASVVATRRGVAVAGTHGKTTTSSMLALVLIEAGLAPSFIVGGELNEIGTGAAWDTGDLFVVEADESDGTFLVLPRHAAIVTNVEPDHLEHYGSREQLEAAFERFVAETPGPVVVCADDPVAGALGRRFGAASYGTSEAADYLMEAIESRGDGTTFVVRRRGEVLGTVRLPIAGLHNARNACAALAMAIELGAPFEAAQAALGRFAGVARRFQHRGTAAGVTFIDDYAHLPAEVASALQAARAGDWRRVVCVFQPHRYSRTAALWQDFADSFVDADVLAITDVYAAGEPPRPGVTGELILHSVIDAHPWRHIAYVPHRDDVVTFLLTRLREGDLCLTLGAGDLTALPDEVRRRLAGGGA